ncbi:Na+-driven multidrug efflux pump [Lutibacter agarilyticus]|uniref:Na+-driven multidrug efflux pump n=1 Tax=Lutibacter agarilyticus TaxID=1109740 RepID=A0A238WTS6_9FLAO|nr:hypothetical protein [Lutibacter agarilyticus]SNR49947.1 Na+-driven multidrug efflux pump [Lutibacter agarilyticus]
MIAKESTMKPANKVILNTVILYSRMILTMGITLYSTRLVLDALGTSDYGIFNLLAGIILMLSFLNSAMATSTQRYLSFYHSSGDIQKQKEIFTNSLFLHIIIGFIVVVFLEVLGFFLFNGFLNIPYDRIDSAKIIYHYMSLTVFFTIVSVPFNSVLIAHENMLWVAIVNIIETFLKLGVALLLYVVISDRLVVFGMLTASITIISFILYAVFCLKNYEECTLEGVLKPKITFLKELGSFAGWNLFGAMCGMGRNQGVALILNIFFGTIVNAAYGVANQVGTQLMFFSNTMLRALNPQIMKSEGANDRERMLRLSMIASKFGFFLLSIFAIPIIFEMESILGFWLKEVPVNTVIFCRLILFASLANQLTIGLQSAMQASGDIKLYQAVVGSVLLLNLPIAYLLIKYGSFPSYFVLISFVFIELIACVLRLIFAKEKLGLSIKRYVNVVFRKEIIPIIGVVAVSYVLLTFFEMHFMYNLILSFIFYLVFIFLFGLNENERLLVLNIYKKIKFLK